MKCEKNIENEFRIRFIFWSRWILCLHEQFSWLIRLTFIWVSVCLCEQQINCLHMTNPKTKWSTECLYNNSNICIFSIREQNFISSDSFSTFQRQSMFFICSSILYFAVFAVVARSSSLASSSTRRRSSSKSIKVFSFIASFSSKIICFFLIYFYVLVFVVGR